MLQKVFGGKLLLLPARDKDHKQKVIQSEALGSFWGGTVEQR